MPHLVTISAGAILPHCKKCGDKVRFVPMIAAERIEADVDFIDETLQPESMHPNI
jgi:hypothetical protein